MLETNTNIDSDVEKNTVTDDTTQKTDTFKPPCHVNFYNNADYFSTQIMQQIPELSAVAVIPIWELNITNIPTGRIRLKNEQQPYVAQLFNVMKKLSEFGVDVHRDIMNQLMLFDNAANNLSIEIKKRADELAALEEQINETAKRKAKKT